MAFTFVRTPFPEPPRLFSSLLLRLCIFMVAAFGSRPCGVSAIAQERSPLIVGLRADHVGDTYGRTYDPASPSLGALPRGTLAVRSPTAPNAGSASFPPADAPVWVPTAFAISTVALPVQRRTPCAACGHGKPYDATAPPRSGIASRA